MVATIGSIRALFEADMRGYVAGLKKGELATASSAARINREVQSVQEKFGRLSSLGATFGKGLFAGIAAGGIGGAAAALRSVAKGMATIGDEARRAGLGVKAFQELGFVARQNRIGVDSLVDGMKELSLRADEWITTGGGTAAEAFKRLGYDATTLRDKLRDPSALFSEIIGKLEKLDKAAQIRIADEIFGGTGGEKFVQLISQGEAKIRDTIRAANDLGIVIDDELIRRADELDRKFEAIADTVGVGLKRAVVEAAGAMQNFIDRFREVDARQTSTLKEQLLEAERNLAAAERGKATSVLPDVFFDRQIEASRAEVERLRMILRDRALQSIRPQLESARDQGAAAKANRLGYVAPVDATASGRKTGESFGRGFQDGLRKYLVPGQSDSHVAGLSDDFAERLAAFMQASPGGISIFSGARSFERQAELFAAAVKKYGSVDAARRWVAPPGSSMHNKGGAADLRFASDSAKEWAHQNAPIYGLNFRMGHEPWHIEMAKDVEDATGKVHALRDSWEDLRVSTADTSGIDAQREAYEELGQIGLGALRGILGALEDGKLEGHELLSILLDVAQQLISMPRAGSGGGGGGLGGILGLIPRIFGFSEGGRVRGPGGPRGDKILARLSDGEHVTRAAMVRKHAGLLAAINADRIPALAEGGFIASNSGAIREHVDQTLAAVEVDGYSPIAVAEQSHSIKDGRQNLTIKQYFPVSGAISSRDIQNMVRQGAEQAEEAVKQKFPMWQQKMARNGVI